MEDLTGRTFTKVDLDENGAPIHPTLLLHVPYAQDEKNPETAASRLLTSIIDNDPEAQAILFHDPRQGAERIASMARRPHQIVPYRAGYLPEERRQIEDKIRSRDLRGVVTTSALEVGIDMPDLNFGINCGLPPTCASASAEWADHPATFVILADLFRRHSENLQVGIDMPDLNFGINCGLPPTRKQMRQRLGRVGRSAPRPSSFSGIQTSSAAIRRTCRPTTTAP